MPTASTKTHTNPKIRDDNIESTIAAIKNGSYFNGQYTKLLAKFTIVDQFSDFPLYFQNNGLIPVYLNVEFKVSF